MAPRQRGERDALAARLWLETLAPGRCALSPDETHYARRVLRLREGDAIEAFDGRGQVARGRVAGMGREAVELELEAASLGPTTGRRVTVALAHPKGERAAWAVEKLTELGVARIVWIDTARAVVEPGDARLDRHARVALAALRQSGGVTLPALEGPVPLAQLLRETAPVRWVGQRGAAPAARAAQQAAGDAIVLVGPEGGLDASELAAARAAGYAEVGLGGWTLRVETAAVVAAAMLLAEP